MKQALWLVSSLGAAIAFAAITPRITPSEYSAQTSGPGFEIGATMLNPARTAKLFPGIQKDFLAIEIGAFPKAGERPELGPDDFALQVSDDPGSQVRRAEPSAAAVQPKPRRSNPLPSNLPVDVGVVVGGGTGPYGTGTGGGVGVGTRTSTRSPYPYPDEPGTRGGSAPSDDNHELAVRRMEVREFPKGPLLRATGGFLFFPLPDGKAKNGFELIYYGGDKKVILPLKMATK